MIGAAAMTSWLGPAGRRGRMSLRAAEPARPAGQSAIQAQGPGRTGPQARRPSPGAVEVIRFERQSMRGHP